MLFSNRTLLRRMEAAARTFRRRGPLRPRVSCLTIQANEAGAVFGMAPVRRRRICLVTQSPGESEQAGPAAGAQGTGSGTVL